MTPVVYQIAVGRSAQRRFKFWVVTLCPPQLERVGTVYGWNAELVFN